MSALPPKADLIASPVLQRRPTRRLITKMVGEPKNPSESIAESRAAILSRPTLKRPDRPDRPDRDELIRPKGQARPIEKRYLLRVDSQLKRSFGSKEPAVIAGTAIKKAYPVVVVTVVDTQDAGAHHRDRQRLGGDPMRDVRFGSKADMCSAQSHVRFVPIADIVGITRHARPVYRSPCAAL